MWAIRLSRHDATGVNMFWLGHGDGLRFTYEAEEAQVFESEESAQTAWAAEDAVLPILSHNLVEIVPTEVMKVGLPFNAALWKSQSMAA
jgi:hypothetical protein